MAAPADDDEREEAVELLGRLADEVLPPAQHGRRVLQRVERRAGDDGRHLMEAEQERGHDPEVAAAATERPVEVRVRRRAGRHQLAAGEHDIGLDEVVDGQPELARQVAHPAPEREPADAGVGDDPGRDGQAERVGRVVDVTEQRAALDARGLLDRVDTDAAHLRQVDDEAVVHGPEARRAVPAAADRDVEALVAAEPTARDDVGDVLRTDGSARDACRSSRSGHDGRRHSRRTSWPMTSPRNAALRASSALLVEARLWSGLGGHRCPLLGSEISDAQVRPRTVPKSFARTALNVRRTTGQTSSNARAGPWPRRLRRALAGR